jgi:uncharacterized protein (DUF433 family)
MAAVTHAHIEVDDCGAARFAGTRFKIIHVILEKIAWELTPEEIQQNHPDLTLAQIYSALAYYYDHQDEIDAQIEQSRREYERLWAENQDSPIRKKLLEIRKQRQS